MAEEVFTPDILLGLLQGCTGAINSIRDVSKWIEQYYQHSTLIAQTWKRFLYQAPINKKINALYIVNDVMHRCKRRKSSELLSLESEFSSIMAESMKHVYHEVIECYPHLESKLVHLSDTWCAKGIFDGQVNSWIRDNMNLPPFDPSAHSSQSLQQHVASLSQSTVSSGVFSPSEQSAGSTSISGLNAGNIDPGVIAVALNHTASPNIISSDPHTNSSVAVLTSISTMPAFTDRVVPSHMLHLFEMSKVFETALIRYDVFKSKFDAFPPDPFSLPSLRNHTDEKIIQLSKDLNNKISVLTEYMGQLDDLRTCHQIFQQFETAMLNCEKKFVRAESLEMMIGEHRDAISRYDAEKKQAEAMYELALQARIPLRKRYTELSTPIANRLEANSRSGIVSDASNSADKSSSLNMQNNRPLYQHLHNDQNSGGGGEREYHRQTQTVNRLNSTSIFPNRNSNNSNYSVQGEYNSYDGASGNELETSREYGSNASRLKNNMRRPRDTSSSYYHHQSYNAGYQAGGNNNKTFNNLQGHHHQQPHHSHGIHTSNYYSRGYNQHQSNYNHHQPTRYQHHSNTNNNSNFHAMNKDRRHIKPIDGSNEFSTVPMSYRERSPPLRVASSPQQPPSHHSERSISPFSSSLSSPHLNNSNDGNDINNSNNNRSLSPSPTLSPIHHSERSISPLFSTTRSDRSPSLPHQPRSMSPNMSPAPRRAPPSISWNADPSGTGFTSYPRRSEGSFRHHPNSSSGVKRHSSNNPSSYNHHVAPFSAPGNRGRSYYRPDESGSASSGGGSSSHYHQAGSFYRSCHPTTDRWNHDYHNHSMSSYRPSGPRNQRAVLNNFDNSKRPKRDQPSDISSIATVPFTSPSLTSAPHIESLDQTQNEPRPSNDNYEGERNPGHHPPQHNQDIHLDTEDEAIPMPDNEMPE